MDSDEVPEGTESTQHGEGDVPEYMPEDMGEEDLIALFVLDDIPLQTLTEILDQNAEHISGDYCLWLADNYDTLPDYCGTVEPGTDTPIYHAWRSPFIGKTIPDVIEFMRNAPKQPKPLSKRCCAVLTKDALDDGLILLCKSLTGERDIDYELADDDEREGRDLKQVVRDLGNDYEDVQVIPTDLDRVGEFHYTFEDYKWIEYYVLWREKGVGLGWFHTSRHQGNALTDAQYHYFRSVAGRNSSRRTSSKRSYDSLPTHTED